MDLQPNQSDDVLALLAKIVALRTGRPISSLQGLDKLRLLYLWCASYG